MCLDAVESATVVPNIAGPGSPWAKRRARHFPLRFRDETHHDVCPQGPEWSRWYPLEGTTSVAHRSLCPVWSQMQTQWARAKGGVAHCACRQVLQERYSRVQSPRGQCLAISCASGLVKDLWVDLRSEAARGFLKLSQ
jgi:hypothetical protein